MKILIINLYYYPNMVGGTEQSIKLLAEDLVSKGHDVFVYTMDGSRCRVDAENINGVYVYRGFSSSFIRSRTGKSTVFHKIKNLFNVFVNRSVSKDLCKLVDEISPDVIHTNNLMQISCYIWKYAKKKNIRVVHTVRDYWMMDPKGVSASIPRIISFFTKLVLKRKSQNGISIVTSASSFVCKYIDESGFFKNSAKVVIPNSIVYNKSLLEECLQQKFERMTYPIIFLYVGALSEIKGIRILLKVFENYKDNKLKLLICGEGPEIQAVLDATYRDNRIQYLGKLPTKKLESVYYQSDVLIVPSMWEEPFGRVIIEGAQYGLMSIVTNKGGMPEIIDKLECGAIYSAENEEQLLLLMNECKDRNIIKGNIKSLTNTLQYYSQTSLLDSFLSIYRSNQCLFTEEANYENSKCSCSDI